MPKNIFFPLLILFFLHFSLYPALYWNQTCGSIKIPYPFYVQRQSLRQGESFKLLCKDQVVLFPLASQGKLYPVLNFSTDSLLIDPLFDSSCTLPNVGILNFTERPQFAISPLNYLQLYNCSRLCILSESCTIPNPIDNCTNVQSSGCLFFSHTSSRNISQYCQFFTSWVLQDNSASLYEVAYGLKLDWTLPKRCEDITFCAQDAECFDSTSINPGHTCKCKEGFKGDGYNEGTGCISDVPACNNSSIASNCSCVESGGCDLPRSNVTKLFAIGTGIFSGIMILASVIIAYVWLRKQKHLGVLPDARRETAHLLTDMLSMHRETLTRNLFSYKELEKATNVFSSKLKVGSGACATVYAGKLQDGRLVAVKRISCSNTQGLYQVINEVNVLCKVNHRCLVSFLGYCFDKGYPLLVFEYVPNGTLWEHLQRQRGEGLDWYTRVTIATDTAEALAHLHSLEPPVFHCDVKSSNILLDYDFNVKVADFGISKLASDVSEESQISTIPQGTPGYLDPEYHVSFHLSDKSDVYSFGVVLIEIITALKPVDFCREKRAVSLAALAVGKIRCSCLDDIIDPFLKTNKDPIVKATVERVGALALRCLAYERAARPSMREAMEELTSIRCEAATMQPVVKEGSCGDGEAVEEDVASKAVGGYVML